MFIWISLWVTMSVHLLLAKVSMSYMKQNGLAEASECLYATRKCLWDTSIDLCGLVKASSSVTME